MKLDLIVAFLSLVLTFLITKTSATATFASCQLPTFISQGLLTSLISLLLINSNSACQTACAGSPYSYFKPASGLLQLSACYCSATPPSITYLDKATDTAADCPTTDYISSILNTSFTFGSCYTTWTDLNNVKKGVYNTISQCLNACSATPVAFATPNANGTWSCSCDKGYSASNSGVCGIGVGMLYSQTVTTSTAGMRKRENLEKELGNRKHVFCPKGLTPCRLPNQLDAYECLDPSTELDSCGGCLYGVYGSQDISAPGVDCTSLPGTLMGSVTCDAGHCVSFRCAHGYSRTMEGDCVPAATSNNTLSSSNLHHQALTGKQTSSFKNQSGGIDETIELTVQVAGVPVRPLWERTKWR